MGYLYKCILYKNPQSLGIPDNSHAANITDFETNHKSTATEVSGVTTGEFTYETEGTYSWFDGTVVDGVDIEWSDAKFIEDNCKYVLIVQTEAAI